MRIIAMVVPLSLLLAACSSLNPLSSNGKVVDRIPEEPPGWLDVRFEEQGERFFAVGNAARVHNAPACDRRARADAERNLLRGMAQKAQSEFSSAMPDSEISDEVIAQQLSRLGRLVTENLVIDGIIPDGNYLERVFSGSIDNPRYHFNCALRISFSVQGYYRARKVALSELKGSAEGPVADMIAKAVERLNQ